MLRRKRPRFALVLITVALHVARRVAHLDALGDPLIHSCFQGAYPIFAELFKIIHGGLLAPV